VKQCSIGPGITNISFNIAVPKQVLKVKPYRRHKSHRKHHGDRTEPGTEEKTNDNIPPSLSQPEESKTLTTTVRERENFPAGESDIHSHFKQHL